MLPEFADLTVNRYLSRERDLSRGIPEKYTPNVPPWSKSDVLTHITQYEQRMRNERRINKIYKYHTSSSRTNATTFQYPSSGFSTYNVTVNGIVNRNRREYRLESITDDFNQITINTDNLVWYNYYAIEDNTFEGCTIKFEYDGDYPIEIGHTIIEKKDTIHKFFDDEVVIEDRYYGGLYGKHQPFPWESESDRKEIYERKIKNAFNDVQSFLSKPYHVLTCLSEYTDGICLWKTREEEREFVCNIFDSMRIREIDEIPWIPSEEEEKANGIMIQLTREENLSLISYMDVVSMSM